MHVMRLRAIYRRPGTSRPAPEGRVYPYLLRNTRITRPNQAWAADITYLPMARGFLYLVAIMDWHSRYVVAWRLSNTLEAVFCIDALQEALEQGQPEVFNTDQGSQFTSGEFTQVLQDHGVKISMDGKGRYTDNIFVERLWRTVKYEEVYLKAYANATEARRELGAYFRFYNDQRPHQALGYRTPAEVFHEARNAPGKECPWKGIEGGGRSTGTSAGIIGISPPKRHIFVDSFPFEEPNHRGKPKKSRTPRRATTRKPKAKQKTTNRKKATPQAAPQPRKPKARVEPTPAELEARQEKRREYERQRDQTPERKKLKRRSTQERRDKAKLLGICVECGAAPPIPDETRCQTCTKRHREYQKQARERAAQKREQASGQTRIF